MGEAMGASMGRLLAVVEQYPNIQSADTYIQMMTSLVEMEDLITQRRVEFNATLRIYNAAISKFPWKLLADWTNFPRFDYFDQASTVGHSAPAITADIFGELMPYLHADEETE